jgi:hypothetical protein
MSHADKQWSSDLSWQLQEEFHQNLKNRGCSPQDFINPASLMWSQPNKKSLTYNHSFKESPKPLNPSVRVLNLLAQPLDCEDFSETKNRGEVVIPLKVWHLPILKIKPYILKILCLLPFLDSGHDIQKLNKAYFLTLHGKIEFANALVGNTVDDANHLLLECDFFMMIDIY